MILSRLSAIRKPSRNEGDALAKALAEETDEPGAILRLLGAHFLEHPGARGRSFTKAVGEIGINVAIFLLERDGDGEDFFSGEVLEMFSN